MKLLFLAMILLSSLIDAAQQNAVHQEYYQVDGKPIPISTPAGFASPIELMDRHFNHHQIEPGISKSEENIPTHTPLATHDYRLNVGDLLLISLYGEDHTRREVLVDPRGKISYLYVDSLPAAGKTIPELREELQEKIRAHYRFALIAITPIRFCTDCFTLLGEVKEPGTKQLVGNPTILSALCMGQGFTTRQYRDQLIDLCDLEHSFIARKGDLLPVDFVKLVRFGDLRHDVPLHPGDYIHIHSNTIKRVYVLGEVFHPQPVDFFNTMSLIEAMAQAGDVTLRASSRIVVLRGSLACPTRFVIDYNRIVKGCACDFPLHPGDIIYVPPRTFQTLREICQMGARAFVAAIASQGASTLVENIYPLFNGSASGGVIPVIGP